MFVYSNKKHWKAFFAQQKLKQLFFFISCLHLKFKCIPKVKDPLGLKKSSRTRSLGYLRDTKKNYLLFATNAVSRSPYKTKRFLETFYRRSWRNKAKSKLLMLSWLPVFSVPHSFSMVETHSWFDIFAIFRFEPMRMLRLGTSILLKECLVSLLNQNGKKTGALKSKQALLKTYKLIRKHVLHTLTLFLKQVERDSLGFWHNVNFKKGRPSHNVSGLFRKDGALCTLEASNFEKNWPIITVIWNNCS